MKRRFQLVGWVMLSALGACSADIVGYRAPSHGDDAAVEPVDLGAPLADAPPAPDVPAVVDVPAVDVPAADVPPVVVPPCVSGVRWTMGNEGSSAMNPGQACVACHVRERSDGPRVIGGTVYAQPMQVDDCNGVRGTGSAYVEATDATGRTFRMTINSAGNFYYNQRTAVVMPLRGVTVVAPSGQRNAMDGDAPHGDCNACHTLAGTTTVAGGDPAPGRILLVP